MFSAPGNLSDFVNDNQRQRWSDTISNQFDEVISAVAPCSSAGSQFVNPANRDIATFEVKAVKWPGFPNSLLSSLSKAEAYKLLDRNSVRARDAMDEYLEWFVHFDGNGDIVAVDFTTETRKYWETLYAMDKDLAARTYSGILGIKITAADISKGGSYDPANRFNTGEGIVHLIQTANTLPAELFIAANATIWRADATGAPTSDVVSCFNCQSPDPLGGADRNSDPLISSSVNTLAREGRAVSIPDPVGLYIDSLNTAGWTTPDGSDITACWRMIRGNPPVRARFEVPGGAFKISEIKIGGQAIQHAAQIAEHVMVTLSAAVGPAGEFKDVNSIACSSRALQLNKAAALSIPSRMRGHG